MARRQGSVHVEVSIVGLPETRKVLRALAPDLARKLTRDMRREVVAIAAIARAKFPVGATGAGGSGFKVERLPTRSGPSGFQGGHRIANRTRQAAILEFAGKASSGHTPQGKSLIAGLNARHGPPGRFLWSTWDEHSGAVHERLVAVVRRSERDLQARLDAVGR